jgi:hypothetical protein
MPRFSFAKMISDPAAVDLKDSSDSDFFPADDSVHKKRPSSASKPSPISRRSSLDDLDDLEHFAKMISKADPKAVKQHIAEATKKGLVGSKKTVKR